MASSESETYAKSLSVIDVSRYFMKASLSLAVSKFIFPVLSFLMFFRLFFSFFNEML